MRTQQDIQQDVLRRLEEEIAENMNLLLLISRTDTEQVRGMLNDIPRHYGRQPGNLEALKQWYLEVTRYDNKRKQEKSIYPSLNMKSGGMSPNMERIPCLIYYI